MKRTLGVLSGLVMIVTVAACGASGPEESHTTTGSTPKTGGDTTVPTTGRSSSTVPTIPPGPAVAASPTTTGPTGGSTGTACLSPSNAAITATPDTTLDNLFQSYGNTGKGATWTDGDGTESVALAGRELWFFSDSYLGTITNGQWMLPHPHFIHNAFVVERRGELTRTLHKRRKGVPVAFLNPVPQDPAGHGFWPGPMAVSGTTLQVIGVEMQFSGNGTFSTLGDSVATFALPSLNLLGLRALPASATDWSGGMLSDGGYTYLYGSSQNNTYAARVLGTNFMAPWSYYDGSGWTPNAAAAIPIETIGTAGHFSVAKVGGLYMFISKASWETDEITAAFGCSPVGPFGPPQPMYATPEGGQYPPADDVVTYGALAHPELSKSSNTLVVSYDVRAVGSTSGTITDASIYRPRFLDVTVSATP
jgi:hypothetical protein